MSWLVPEGSHFYFTTDFDTPASVTNVATSGADTTFTGGSFTGNEEVLFISGWEDASDTIWKLDGSNKIGGLDSSNTDFFTPGGGNGTLAKVNTWTELKQPLTIDTSGGDARFIEVDPLNRRNSFQIPTGFNANTTTLTVGYDPTDPNYQAAVAASRTLQKVGFKFLLSGGATGYSYGYITASEMPTMTKGQVLTANIAIASIGRFISYPS